jgi:hypothetical protein
LILAIHRSDEGLYDVLVYGGQASQSRSNWVGSDNPRSWLFESFDKDWDHVFACRRISMCPAARGALPMICAPLNRDLTKCGNCGACGRANPLNQLKGLALNRFISLFDSIAQNRHYFFRIGTVNLQEQGSRFDPNSQVWVPRGNACSRRHAI